MDTKKLGTSAKYASYTIKNLILCIVVHACFLNVLYAQKKDGFLKTKNARTAFDKRVEELMNDVGVPALSFAVIRNNRLIFYDEYGYKSFKTGDKVNKKTIFEAASLTKTFLVYVAYKLADERKLDLDKPMYQYLEYDLLKHDPRYKHITARMILNHASGVENWKRENNPEVLEIMNDPGKSYVYSGEAYQYLAKVIELILHKPYETYINDMVLKPFKLRRTFTSYKREGKYPRNYAEGHSSFGKQLNKWKNPDGEPASGIHLIAKDYAKLMISMFDGKHLSDTIVKSIKNADLKMEANVSDWYSNSGFGVIFTKNDTIIHHGGVNEGFKAFIAYSLVSKDGIIMLTNGDRGDVICKELNDMSVALNLDTKFEADFISQYPNNSNYLLKVYREKNVNEMFNKLDELIKEKDGKIDVKTLNEMGYLFFAAGNNRVARKLFETNVKLYPESSIPYYFLGQLDLFQKDFDSAYANFRKAKDYNFKYVAMDYELNLCKEKIEASSKVREITPANINEGQISIIKAADYCAMSGIDLEKTSDDGGGQNLSFTDPGNWMDYNLNVLNSGSYKLDLRIASKSGGQLRVMSGSTLLSTVDIASTMGWQKWSTLSTSVNLPAGSQVLRLYVSSGSFNINWMKFYTLN